MRPPISRTASSNTFTRSHLRVVTDDDAAERTFEPVALYLDTLRGQTMSTYRWTLRTLFRDGRTPESVTEDQLLRWACEDRLSNNTIRTRLTAATSFYRWYDRHGYPSQNPCHPDVVKEVRRRYPKTYGKVQSKNAARWLTHDEAFVKLLAPCQDGTLLGVRDEIMLRLGLAGLRLTEIVTLPVRAIDLHTGRLHWTGKGRRPRTATLSPKLAGLLRDWMTKAPTEIDPEAPVLCIIRPEVGANGRYTPGTQAALWGHGLTKNAAYKVIVQRAADAGLGHVAPHDLRRTVAGILHNARSDDGGHHFDLLDIQKVLDHADPATTMRSYLDPMDTGVKDKAATFLD